MNKLALLCIQCSPLALAGPITQIEIENNIVLFSTSSMMPSTAACVKPIALCSDNYRHSPSPAQPAMAGINPNHCLS